MKMNLNKAAKQMVYELARTVKADNPKWSNHDCFEEAFIKCAGISNYDEPLESILGEFYKKELANIS